MLKWNKWEDPKKIPDDIPFDTPVLVEVDNYKGERVEYRIGIVREIQNGKLCIIGDRFYDEHNPVRWTFFQHLIEKEP